MITLQQLDPFSYRYEPVDVMINPDDIQSLTDKSGEYRVNGKSVVLLKTGERLHIAQSISEINDLIQQSKAGQLSEERIRSIVRDELAKAYPEMADKAWRYDESSK